MTGSWKETETDLFIKTSIFQYTIFLTISLLLLNFFYTEHNNLFRIYGVYNHEWGYSEKTLVRPPKEYIYSIGGFCFFSS